MNPEAEAIEAQAADIVPRTESRELASREPPTITTGPLAMMLEAVRQNVPPATVREWMALQAEHEAREARKAFVAAMAAFKANPPRIVKDRSVNFSTSRGETSYRHATLAAVCEAIIGGLSGVGISHRWITDQGDGGRITVHCELTHVSGHCERTSLAASPDDSGGKNAIQAIGSTVSYLQRYTLLAATGMSTADQDDDGRGGPDDKADELTEEQEVALETWREKCREATSVTDLHAAWSEMDEWTRAKLGRFVKDRKLVLEQGAA